MPTCALVPVLSRHPLPQGRGDAGIAVAGGIGVVTAAAILGVGVADASLHRHARLRAGIDVEQV